MSMHNQAPRYFALIPAAGVGARMAASGPKQYLHLGGKPMLRHTLDAFLSSER
ncbi:MAG: 2-C-methyl-D-erythritol 4-phosphate cytidylyltransferase, partial [Pseudomonadota bacterium]